MSPLPRLMRQRRSAAALALVGDERRRQATWDDLAAWPDWAALGEPEQQALARRAGAWLHAGVLQRCIAGAVLQHLQTRLGEAAFQRLMKAPQAATPDPQVLPPANTADAAALDAWLLAQGYEVLLASVPSPLLRLLLRERVVPRTLPPLPALDSLRAQRALQQALA